MSIIGIPVAVGIDTKERIAITEVTLEVDSLESLNKIIRELRRIDSVYDVNRKK